MTDKPPTIFLTGLPGVGKSTIARQLSRTYGLKLIDTDAVIVKTYGRTIADIFRTDGNFRFRQLESQVLENIIAQCSEPKIISTGGGLPCYFDNMSKMKNAGQVIYVHDDLREIARRLAFSKIDRPLLTGKTDCEIKKWLLDLLANRHWYYRQSDYFTLVSKADQQIGRILAAWTMAKK